ncbi:MAG: bifunctional diaminohydroxyphosphoribosylaminopyrimidine deaminase/5-amino-6-(5-phosphoribosylamino)uracil reductase RibD [Muribaculaceae bacterium]|nr:bifunctional diaminohydroxyphosphoribosylaminopyrimidine deaminase/5-amino-6-(5-phosphoribosylamino)uracil reductase RibD [Muribaculaceae bacterium]MDE7082000.1 bifunctional diaminohydroxyphosphoribosylaminopyrimidine deaminase/5-amino-6-(5-phosphoribosylamino)uracil reductase RibD [Muribaculaceae bacterium]
MDILSEDIIYMRRALQLAACGYGHTFTNPMVGAVIVAPGGRIIGQGWHRRYGGPHAEVNAVRAVSAAHRPLLPQSTIYVTLEPCSHFGKTPPCASLLIREGIRRVVVGATDPFPEVAGRGLRMLRDAGCEVTTGVLEKECVDLNLHFMTAHRLGRPFVMLKWAQSADAYIGSGIPDGATTAAPQRVVFSSMLGQLAVHRLRASFQGVMAGVNTVIADNPRLDCRLWPAPDQPVAISRRSSRLPADARILQRDHILREPSESLPDFLRRLYTDHRFNAILVEGGREVLQEFIDLDIFDAIRVETSPVMLGKGVKAPDFNPSALTLQEDMQIGGNYVRLYHHCH